jgi:hypothetical protein
MAYHLGFHPKRCVPSLSCSHQDPSLQLLALYCLRAFRSGASAYLRLKRKDRVKHIEPEQKTVTSKMATQNPPPPDAGPAEEQLPEGVSTLATTFGIEFECVLAFHESEPHRVLEENGIVAVVHNDLLSEKHRALLGDRKRDSHRRSHFPSWGFMSPLLMIWQSTNCRYIVTDGFDLIS